MVAMRLIGKSPINPVLFFSGKIAGYAIWGVLLVELTAIDEFAQLNTQKLTALILAFCGLAFMICSLVNLGASTRLGLPEERTALKTAGIYRISRNPMYLGFNLLSVSAVLYTHNLIVLVLGMYSIFTYHLIILAEERFLEKRFNDKYLEYKRKVHRYL